MIRLLGYIHQNVLTDELQNLLHNLDEKVIVEYKKVVYNEQMTLYYERNRLFGLHGDYSKTGGKGIEVSLFRSICEILSAKVDDLSDETLCALKTWLELYPDSGHPLDEERYNDFITKAKGDKITGYILSVVLKHEQPEWGDKYISSFVEEEMERINRTLLLTK